VRLKSGEIEPPHTFGYVLSSLTQIVSASSTDDENTKFALKVNARRPSSALCLIKFGDFSLHIEQKFCMWRTDWRNRESQQEFLISKTASCLALICVRAQKVERESNYCEIIPLVESGEHVRERENYLMRLKSGARSPLARNSPFINTDFREIQLRGSSS